MQRSHYAYRNCLEVYLECPKKLLRYIGIAFSEPPPPKKKKKTTKAIIHIFQLSSENSQSVVNGEYILYILLDTPQSSQQNLTSI